MAKWVYKFHEGSAAMRNLLGGKGCNLAEMTNLGMPIPQGLQLLQRLVPSTITAASRFRIIQEQDFEGNHMDGRH